MNSRTQFSFSDFDARGAAVRLESAWQQVRMRNNLPPAVQQLLGEALAAVGLMISNLKLDGRVSLQLQGGEQLTLLLVECSSSGMLRGVANCAESIDQQTAFADLTVGATMAITIEPDQGQRYQGIVPLSGDSLAHSLEGYFQQSEQLASRLWLAADEQRAVGLMLQKMPTPELTADNDEDGWNRIGVLADTLTAEEMLALPASQIVHRLFHREKLLAGGCSPLQFGCSCSRERVVGVLAMLGRDEVASAIENDALEVSCEFCNQRYPFDPIDLEQIFLKNQLPGPTTLQ